jgi:hypothetical protein
VAVADDIWIAPTYQADLGGLGIGSNALWPVSAVGAVRLVWAVPNDLQTLQSSKVALIPHAPGGAADLNIIICSAANAGPVVGACVGPFTHPFVGVANRLVEVDISADIAPSLGSPGASYMTVVAFTTPTTATDHILGMRVAYDRQPAVPAGLVGFFAGSSCPSGWSEYTTARGRVIVGLPSGGTPEGTQGVSLGDLQPRTISDVPSHSHSIDPPSSSTSTNGSHNHDIDVLGFAAGLDIVAAPVTGLAQSTSTSSDGSHSHTINIGTFSSAPTGVAAVDVSMPYLQLMTCRKL